MPYSQQQILLECVICGTCVLLLATRKGGCSKLTVTSGFKDDREKCSSVRQLARS